MSLQKQNAHKLAVKAAAFTEVLATAGIKEIE